MSGIKSYAHPAGLLSKARSGSTHICGSQWERVCLQARNQQPSRTSKAAPPSTPPPPLHLGPLVKPTQVIIILASSWHWPICGSDRAVCKRQRHPEDPRAAGWNLEMSAMMSCTQEQQPQAQCRTHGPSGKMNRGSHQEAQFQTPLSLFRFYSVLFGGFQWYYICLIINFSISDRKEIQS